MSVTTISNSEMIHKNSFLHRKASKELEVFEAARYFSEYNETATAATSTTKFTQKVKKKDKGWIKGRISLDMPVKNILNLPPQQPCTSVIDNDHQKPMAKKEKKFRQPNSPGGRLASFLNSLFSHSVSGKKKKKTMTKSSVQSMEDDDENSGGVTSKRRISISHFRSSNSAETKFMFSPDPDHRHHVQTPTKSYRELLSFSKFNRHLKSGVATAKPATSDGGGDDDRRQYKEPISSVEEIKSRSRDGVLEKKQKNDSEKYRMEFMKFDDDFDDGGETDSSSDLFELQIYDLDYYSTGLPVYESTDIDRIKRRNSISNGLLH